MFPEENGPSEAAIDYANEFVDAGVEKLDALFGAGYARENPQMLAAYMGACATNLNSFMVAASSFGNEAMEEALLAFEEQLPPPPPPQRKGKRR